MRLTVKIVEIDGLHVDAHRSPAYPPLHIT